jgi:hypothetical protein
MSRLVPARRSLRVGSRLTGSLAVVTVLVSFVSDLTANQLGALGEWVPLTVGAGTALAAVVLWLLAHPDPSIPDAVERRTLADRSPLYGRDDVIAETVRKSGAQGCVVVRGPAGIGTSAVAMEALRRLAPEPAQRHWVDAVDQDDRGVRLNVLRELHLPADHTGRDIAELVVNRLRGSGEALLIDNVTDPDQALWIARRITRAYVIVAGDLPPAALPNIPEVVVGGLAPEYGKRLFQSPYGEETPPEPPRRRPWWRGPRRERRRMPNSIERRMAAEPEAADELARSYLLRPRIVKEAGRLFDAHPNISVTELLELLRRSGPSRPAGPPDPGDRFRAVFQSLLVGVPKDGRRLLELMAPLPYAAYEPSALAVLARWPRARTSACVSDLVARTLVRQSPGGVRLSDQVRALPLGNGTRRRTRARRRLFGYYAELAADHADRLATERHREAREWFDANDAVLKRLTREPWPAAEIVAIADALEVWYAQEGRAADRQEVASALVKLGVEPAASVGYLRLAAMARTRGDKDAAARNLDKASALDRTRGMPQWRTEAALQRLDAGDLLAARVNIEACLDVRPLSDARGRIGDEINLGVIATRESAAGPDAIEPHAPAGPETRRAAAEAQRAAGLERAYHHFVLALDLAEAIGDISGQAHAREMIGGVLARQQKTQAALREWEAAGELWAQIGDEAGRRRCDAQRALGA